VKNNINKKIIMSGLSIVASLAMLGGSAFAAFATSATASGSTFSTGVDNLLVSSDNNTYSKVITSPFTGTKITPGFNQPYTFFLKNDNSNSTDNLDVTATFSGGTANAILDPVLMTQFTCVDPINGTTTATAFPVASMRGGQVSLGTINSGEIATCKLTVSLPSTADNTVAGQTTTFDVVFNGATAVTPTPTL
jgi:hypothetical protein